MTRRSRLGLLLTILCLVGILLGPVQPLVAYALVQSPAPREPASVAAVTRTEDRRPNDTASRGQPGGVSLRGRPVALPAVNTLPTPTAYDILHHGSPSTPWTTFDESGANALFGNFVWQELDLSVPGRGLGFAFLRTYNSAMTTDGPLGMGWTHLYNMRLTVESASSVLVQMGDGRLDRYSLSVGSYVPPTGIYNTLTDNGGAFTLTLKDQTRYAFDASGRLATVSDRNNNTVTLAYTGDSLTTVTDPAGRAYGFAYNASGRLVSLTDPAGRQVTFTYNAAGDLETVTDPRGKVTTYGYDAARRLVSLTDANGHTQFRLTYDDQGRLIQLLDAEDYATRLGYSFAEGQTTVTDPLGNATVYQFDDGYRLLGVRDALGNSTVAAYDASNNLISSTDKRGNTTQYQYDARGNVTQTTDALGGVVRVSYDSQNDPLTVTNQRNFTTTFGYDANGNLLTITDARAALTRFTYDAYGQVTGITDAEGRATPVEYDAVGNLKKITDALTRSTSFNYDLVSRMTDVTDPRSATTRVHYDAADNPTDFTDHLGNVTRLTYDAVGNRLTVTDAKNNTTAFQYDRRNLLVRTTNGANGVATREYDGNGNLTRVVDENNHAAVTQYDALGRVTRVTDAAGSMVQYEYDANSNVTRVTDPTGASTATEYDALNRVVRVANALGFATTTEYDVAGNKTAAVDANGRRTTFAYDELNRLLSTTDAEGNVVRYEYDRVGNLTATVNARLQRTEYTYDALNRVTSERDPLSNTVSSTYDEHGNRLTLTDANGKTTNWTYDPLNRISRIDYPASGGNSASSAYFGYDAVGSRTVMTDTTGITRYTYDNLQRLTAVTNPFNQTASYQYDAVGNRTQITYPTGNIARFIYDAANRLKQVTEPGGTTTYTYNARGDRTRVDYANGISGAFLYDAGGRLTDIRYTSPIVGNYLSISYALDKVGNRTQMVDNEGLTTYTYDKVYRLTAVTYPDGSHQSFTYDAAGNRLSMTDGSGTTGYSYDDADRLTTMTPPSGSPVTFTWDNNGNMLSRSDGTTYTWDAANRLTKTVVTHGSTADSIEFSYDGDGRRTSKSVNGVVSNYLWDTISSLPVILNEREGNQDTDFVYGHELLSEAGPGGRAYYHPDGLGSTRSLSSPTGQETAGYKYDAFGAIRGQTGTTKNSFLFSGQQLDMETGLYYLRARYYDPKLGMFLSRDPVGNIEGLYRYAANNPINRIDPMGQLSWGDVTSFTKKAVSTVQKVTSSIQTKASQAVQYVSKGVQSAVASYQSFTKPYVRQVAQTIVKYNNDHPSLPLATMSGELSKSAWLVAGGTVGVSAQVMSTGVGVAATPILAKVTTGSIALAELFSTMSKGLYFVAAAQDTLSAFAALTLSGTVPQSFQDALKESSTGYATAVILDKAFPVQGNATQKGVALGAQNLFESAVTQLFTPRQQNSSGSNSSAAPVGYRVLAPGAGASGQPSLSTSVEAGFAAAGNVAVTAGDSSQLHPSIPGPSTTFGHSPNQPSAAGAEDWYIAWDAVPPEICADQHGDLDGNPIVAYDFLVIGINSNWYSNLLTSRCVRPPTLGSGAYIWATRVWDSTGHASEWSESRYFVIVDQGLRIDPIEFSPASPSNNEAIKIYTCVRGYVGLGADLGIYVNSANDGSADGTWRKLGINGQWCFNHDDTSTWLTWFNRDLADGPHLVRAEGNDHGNIVETTAVMYLGRRRPSDPVLTAPASQAWLTDHTATFRWESTNRADSYLLEVSTTPNPAVSPIFSATLDGSAASYTYTFSQDYPVVYWRLTAHNEMGDVPMSRQFSIDTGLPTSQVTALPTTVGTTSFRVAWGGSDSLSGVRQYDVQVRDGADGTWQFWKTQTTETSAIYTGEDGHTYYFRSRATDQAGNVEAFPDAADGDAQTHVDTSYIPSVPWWRSDYLYRQKIVVTASQAIPQNYAVKLTTDVGALMAAGKARWDQNDWRIVYWDGVKWTELNRDYISATQTYFALQSALGAGQSDAGYYAYYGNPAETSAPPSNRAAVYRPGISGDYYFFTRGNQPSFEEFKGTFLDNTLTCNADTLEARLGGRHDNLIVKWEGQVYANFDEVYTFAAAIRDGAHVWVDENLVVNTWPSPDEWMHTYGSMALSKGWHRVRAEFFVYYGFCIFNLMYASPSTGVTTLQVNPDVLAQAPTVAPATEEMYTGPGPTPTPTLPPPTATPTPNPARWWNTDYPYRRQIVVSAAGADIPAPYWGLLSFDLNQLGTKHNGDFSNVRVVYTPDGASYTELNRLIQGSGSIYFPIDHSIAAHSSDGGYWLYYGALSPGPVLADRAQIFTPRRDDSTTGLWYLDEGSGASSYNQIAGGSSVDYLGEPYDAYWWGTSRITGRPSIEFTNQQNALYPQIADYPGLRPGDLTVELYTRGLGMDSGDGYIIQKGLPGKSYAMLVRQGSGLFAVQLSQDGSNWWTLEGGSNYANYNQTNGYIHVAMTYEAATGRTRFYANGQLRFEGMAPFTGPLYGGTDHAQLGSPYVTMPHYNRYQGGMSLLRVSNIARTSFPYAQIDPLNDPGAGLSSEEYQPGLPPSPTPPPPTPAPPFWGTGADGDHRVGGTEYTDNVGYALRANADAGTRTLSPTSVSGFNPGDEVLLIQMQGSGAGTYEFQRIAAVDTGQTLLTLQADIGAFYRVGGTDRAQVIRVPNWRNLTVPSGATLTVHSWDRNAGSGGVLVFRASGTVSVQSGGGISAAAAGFGGGVAGTVSPRWFNGGSGESYTGPGTQAAGEGSRTPPNAGAGGGGRGASAGSPGGGGGAGYGYPGQKFISNQGSAAADPGASYGSYTLTTLYLGSGGGGGGGGGTGAPGGRGGGAVIILAREVNLAGYVSVVGETPGRASSGGGGGGGSGGSVLLRMVRGSLGTGLVDSSGGNSGAPESNGDAYQSWGGYGGYGRVRVEYCTQISGSANPPVAPAQILCALPLQTSITATPNECIPPSNPSFAWAQSDSGLPADQVEYSTWLEGYESGWSSWGNVTSKSYSVLPEGAYKFHVKARDRSGHEEESPPVYSFRVDSSPPTGTIRINSGDTTTNKVAVHLAITGNDGPFGCGVSQMRLANDDRFYGDWRPVADTIEWTLPSGDRMAHTVYLQLQDTLGNTSGEFSGSIFLDLYPPRPASASYQLGPRVAASGSGSAQSESYQLRSSTLGQPIASDGLHSGQYQLASGYQGAALPAQPKPTATSTPTSSSTPTAITTATWTPIPTNTQTNTPPPTSTATSTPIPTSTATNTPTSSSTATSTPPPTSTATWTPLPTNTATWTPVPTNTATSTPLPTSTPTDTPLPTSTATWTSLPTSTATSTPLPTSTATWTTVPTSTATWTPTWTPLPTSTATWTPLPTSTATWTPVPTSTATGTPTWTPLPTSTATWTPLPTNTATWTPLPTSTATWTLVPTNTATWTAAPTSTATWTPLSTNTATWTPVSTNTATNTPLPTSTATWTPLPTSTATWTTVPTSTATWTPVPTNTATWTPLPTSTVTWTPLPTSTATWTPIPTNTTTGTPLRTSTATSTPLSTSTATWTPVPTSTATWTPIPTSTATWTAVPTSTPTPTSTSTPTPPVQVVQTLSLSITSAVAGQSIVAQFSVKNMSATSLTIRRLIAAARGPNCTDMSCNSQVDFPPEDNLTLQPGEEHIYRQMRSFTSLGVGYMAEVSYMDANGEWQGGLPGGNRVNFTVSPGLQVVRALSLSPNNPAVGQTITAQFTVHNFGNQAVTLRTLVAAARGPDCADMICANSVDFSAIGNVVVQPFQDYVYSGERVFTQIGSGYIASPSYQDEGGLWHDVDFPNGNLVLFSVVPAPTTTATATNTLTPTSTNTPTATSTWTNTPTATNTPAPVVVRFYASAGDGRVSYTGASLSGCSQTTWNTGHNATSGTASYTTAANTNWVGTGCASGSTVNISRGFLVFDTSALPDNAVITSASVYVYVTGKTDSKNDANGFVSIVQGLQASTASLTTTDYAKAGSAITNPIEGSNRLDISTIPTTSFGRWDLNTAGLGWVSKTGVTKLALREGHDIVNAWPSYTANQGDYISVYLSEQTGTSQDPYIEVTYITGAAALNAADYQLPAPEARPSLGDAMTGPENTGSPGEEQHTPEAATLPSPNKLSRR